MSRIVAYARIAPGEPPEVEREQSALFAQLGVPPSNIFIERTDWSAPRPVLDSAIASVDMGDAFAVHSLYRLCSSARSLVVLLAKIEGRGANFRMLAEGIDTSNQRGAHFRTDAGILAGMEVRFLRERQAIGIERAKREGKYLGRAPTAQARAAEVYRLRDAGLTFAKIGQALGISEASAYQINKKRGVAGNADEVEND